MSFNVVCVLRRETGDLKDKDILLKMLSLFWNTCFYESNTRKINTSSNLICILGNI